MTHNGIDPMRPMHGDGGSHVNSRAHAGGHLTVGHVYEYEVAQIPEFLQKRPEAPQGMDREQFIFWLQGLLFGAPPNPSSEQSHEFLLAVRAALKGLK